MTPLEVMKENQRREREARRAARGKLPPRQPAPSEHKAKLDEVRARCASKKGA